MPLVLAKMIEKVVAKEKIYKEIKDAINMTPAELRVWLRTDLAPITVANYQDCPSIEQSKKWLRIIGKDKEELTSADCDFARVMIQRLKYLKRVKNKNTHNKLDWENSLRNFGYDIKKEVSVYKSLQY